MRMLAASVLIAAIACSPRVSEFEQRGDRYSARGDYVDAQKEYELALDQAGEDAQDGLRLKAAELALRSKDLQAAERLAGELTEESSEIREEIAALYFLHARRWAAMGDTFAALQAVEWLAAQDSTAGLGALYYLVGDAAYARPDYEEAIGAYLMGLARAPEAATPLVYYRLGEAHERRRNCAAAIEYFQRYLAATEAGAGDSAVEEGDIRYRLGSCAFRLAERAFAGEDYERAVDYIELTVQTGEPVSRLADADLMMARIHERLGNREQAMEYYERVLNRSRDRSSRTAVEAFRRLKQLEFGMSLETAEHLAAEAARDSIRALNRAAPNAGPGSTRQ